MHLRAIIQTLLAVVLVSGMGCEPYSDPSSTSLPSGPSEAWRGTYHGTCLLTCPSLGIYTREMSATVRCNPAAAELHVELFLVPDLAYTPKYRRTGPVVDENRIHYYIEDEVFVYHASLNRGGDHLGGTLQVSDLSGTLIWQAVNISVERD